MNKNILALTALVLVFALGLTACGCAHKTWQEADCLNPKTCADCGETEGEALGHSWKNADCVNPKTCTRCATTEGTALGHAWVDATCAAPKTCSNCGLTEGTTLEHTWTDATTEAPKTCTACGATEGERIVTDPRFTTASTKDFYGEWTCGFSLPGAATGLTDFETPFEVMLHMTLSNDGTAAVTASLKNVEEMEADLVIYMSDMLYESLEAMDLSKEEADAYINDTFGMTMTEYATAAVDAMNLSHLFDYISISGVYYVAGGEFFIGDSWDATMDVSAYTMDGNTLILHDDIFGTGAENTVFTRAAE